MTTPPPVPEELRRPLGEGEYRRWTPEAGWHIERMARDHWMRRTYYGRAESHRRGAQRGARKGGRAYRKTKA